MQSVESSFQSLPKRSGHACCYVPPYPNPTSHHALCGCLVQFGGWPPSAELKRVVRKEGSHCPLYALNLNEVVVTAAEAEKKKQSKHTKKRTLGATPHTHQGEEPDRERETADALLLERIEGMKRLPHLLREFHAHLAHESTTAYTRENSVSGEEEDGYISEASDFLGGEENPAGSSTDEESDGSGEEEEETIHVVPVTAERLQQLQSEFHDNHPSANRAVSESAYTSVTAHTNRPMPSVGVASQYSYRPPPTAQPTQEREDMDSNSVLQWKPVLPPIAPKTRHGHALVYCYPNLYLFGGCYWAHGDAMSTTDLYYNVYDQRWRQCKEEVVPPRFMASVAVSNASHTFPQHTDHTVSENDPNRAHMVLYVFGGLDFNRQLSNHLYRTQLPPSRYELLPQLGHTPRPQFKGVLVCDVQRETEGGEGCLYYMDGFQEGKPMTPCIRQYTLQTGMWRRLGTSPDLVRSQLSYLEYTPLVLADGVRTTQLSRFDIMGGMPSRRGRQYRSRWSHSFSVADRCYDYTHEVTGLRAGMTAHAVVLLPSPGHHPQCPFPEKTTERTTPLRHTLAVSCGGNEDLRIGNSNALEANSLGEPIGLIYLLRRRPISFSEAIRVFMHKNRIPLTVTATPERDAILDELF